MILLEYLCYQLAAIFQSSCINSQNKGSQVSGSKGCEFFNQPLEHVDMFLNIPSIIALCTE
ncbi:hypothetical protein H2248_005476 [Termitomyces sp. 'cryptogamus']|nr:hypothetical protein H2248_005476 [Termitomyces sp. 'cryptogamus']